MRWWCFSHFTLSCDSNCTNAFLFHSASLAFSCWVVFRMCILLNGFNQQLQQQRSCLFTKLMTNSKFTNVNFAKVWFKPLLSSHSLSEPKARTDSSSAFIQHKSFCVYPHPTAWGTSGISQLCAGVSCAQLHLQGPSTISQGSGFKQADSSLGSNCQLQQLRAFYHLKRNVPPTAMWNY